MDNRAIEQFEFLVGVVKLFRNFKSLEAIKNSSAQKNYLNIEALLESKVSKDSRFKDEVWELQSLEHDQQSRDGLYNVDWAKFTFLPDQTVLILKLLLLSAITKRNLFSYPKKSSGERDLKIVTIVIHFTTVLSFLDAVYSHLESEYGELIVDDYADFYQIGYDVFYKVAETFTSYRVDISLCNILDNPKVINLLDVEAPGFRFKELPFIKVESKNRDRNKFIPSKEFEKILSHSTLSVQSFLKVMNVDAQCDSSQRYFEYMQSENRYSLDYDWTREKLETVGFRYRLASYIGKAGKGNKLTKIDLLFEDTYKNNRFGYSLSEFMVSKANVEKMDKRLEAIGVDYNLAQEYITDVMLSSMFLIWSLTGMRPSEFLSMKYSRNSVKGSLIEEDGLNFLRVKISKGRDSVSSLFNDKYLAIPIILDAYESILLCKEILFSECNLKLDKPFNAHRSAIDNRLLDIYMQDLSNNVLGEDIVDFYPYLMRHNLAYQLYRVGLGLPYISFALKHLVSGIDRFSKVSDVTLKYGDLGDVLIGNANDTAKLRKQAGIESIAAKYDPDGNYAGGAAKKHKEKIGKVFQAYMAAGYSKQEIFEAMYDQGYYLANVGGTFCLAENAKESFDDSLPCIGSLRCNPLECENALISNEHTPKWQEIVFDLEAVKKKIEGSGDTSSPKLAQINCGLQVGRKVLASLNDNGRFCCG